jgi:hypothetical protein
VSSSLANSLEDAAVIAGSATLIFGLPVYSRLLRSPGPVTELGLFVGLEVIPTVVLWSAYVILGRVLPRAHQAFMIALILLASLSTVRAWQMHGLYGSDDPIVRLGAPLLYVLLPCGWLALWRFRPQASRAIAGTIGVATVAASMIFLLSLMLFSA